MTNSTAYPIARVTSPREAYEIAQRVIGLTDVEGAYIDFRAVTDTREGVYRFIAGMPVGVLNVNIAPVDVDRARKILGQLVSDSGDFGMSVDGGLWGVFRSDEIPAVQKLKDLPASPISFELQELPLSAIDLSVLNVVERDPASIVWWLNSWPAVPELGLTAQGKHCVVQLTLNSTDINELTPSPEHVVYVHTGPWSGEDARAEWLANMAGQSIVGPPEWGW